MMICVHVRRPCHPTAAQAGPTDGSGHCGGRHHACKLLPALCPGALQVRMMSSALNLSRPWEMDDQHHVATIAVGKQLLYLKVISKHCTWL